MSDEHVCPFCAEPVDADAGTCPACGESLGGAGAGQGSSPVKIVLVVLGVLLLLAVCVIGIAAAIMVPALGQARARAQVATARSQIFALQAALAMYEADTGRYPRLAPRQGEAALVDAAPALYAGLCNDATLELGGGPNSPYVMDWRAVGTIERANLQPGAMGDDWTLPDPTGVTPLADAQRGSLTDPAFQQQHGPASEAPLVLLDPWGNPLHYREWASVRDAIKAELTQTRTCQGGAAGLSVSGPIEDGCHNDAGYDLWSNGPNGVNEYGAPGSDDVTNWTR